MNLFNVSLTQTAKSAGAPSASGIDAENGHTNASDFSQQYQQAIDENQPLFMADTELTSVTDASVSADVDIETHDQNETVTVDAITVAEKPANDTVVDDTTQLMAAGNAFLTQLTQSNQQLNGSANASTNANSVSDETANGNSLPLLATTVTTPATLTSAAAILAHETKSQKAGESVDVSVNNSPLLATSDTTMSTSITQSGMSILDDSHVSANGSLPADGSLPVNGSLFVNDGLLASDSRSHQSSSVNASSESLAHQLAGLTTASTTTLKPEQPATVNNAQSPLLLTREQAGEQVHERINMMMAKNLKYVDIRLDPPELGKIQIKLTINQDQASVQFTVNNPQTRDIVEQAMPRLREMLQQQGLQLAQSSVQQESSQQFSGNQNNSSAQSQSQSGQQPSSLIVADERQMMADNEQLETQTTFFAAENKDNVDYYA